MGKASTADYSSVESYLALSFLCSDHFTEDLFRGGVGCHGGLGWREGRLYSLYLLQGGGRWLVDSGRVGSGG